MRAALALATHTGWQPSEIGALTWGDFWQYLTLLPKNG